ncbi:MAG TPA: tocopherol cyclase family protein [Deltaproteobacteria bacterium]|jgi:hypothetical protein|nr:tocopherol cyclase family protein [Deltaproteobacteria bacterium]HOI06666.1 tocopherol cyclase family protein [Deltaproteobacteria bacterium]
MFRWLSTTLNPEAYHGSGRRPPFFEGWYFKVVNAAGDRRYAVIPGIYLSREPGGSHAFIQISDGTTGSAAYRSYPVGEFVPARKRFDVSIGRSRFSTGRMLVDIDGPELDFLSPVAWPVTLLSPGVMGWYAWMPFMECYHGVVSMDHGIRGGLTINGEYVSFDGGRGYTEKDWGRSFPSAWIWMQSNHFPETGTSLSASMAVVPWIGRSFAGFTAGFLHRGRLLRFATYTGAVVEELSITDHEVSWTIRDREHVLEITATRAEGSLLLAPSVQAMDRRITETLTAAIEVRLHARSSGRSSTVFHGIGVNAGLEAAGDVAGLRDLWTRGLGVGS